MLSLRGEVVQEAGGRGGETGKEAEPTYGVLGAGWLLSLGNRAPWCKTPSEELCVRIVSLGDGGVTFISQYPSEDCQGV